MRRPEPSVGWHRADPARIRLFAVALLVGVLVACTTALLIGAIAALQGFLFGGGDERYFATVLAEAPWWRVVFAPLLGGLVVGVLIYGLPGRRYHGIADVMEACAFRGGRMDVRSGAGAATAAVVSLGAGASVGREGPAVHIGASLSAWFADKLGLSRSHSLTLLGCGAAAAVTASFNAPIAGVLFALEVVVGYYTLRVFAPIVVASMGALVVTQVVQEHADFAFVVPTVSLASIWELPIFAVLGACAAMCTVVLVYAVQLVQDAHNQCKVPLWLRPAIGGLVVGFIGLYVPYALGVGYQTTDLALKGTLVSESGLLISVILVAKLAATAVSLGSGFAGGVFGPALVLGAVLGTAVAGVFADVLPGTVSMVPVYAIVGMAAVASATLGAPISTILIVFELTGNYNIVAAVMLASAVASSCMSFTPFTSYFRWQLQRRGVNIVAGRDQSLLRTETIDSLVSEDFCQIGEHDSLMQVQIKVGACRRHAVVMLDNHQRFIGSASLRDLIRHNEDGEPVPVINQMRGSAESLRLGTSLSGALDALVSSSSEFLPVVEQDEDGELRALGIVRYSDVLARNNVLLKQARAEEFGVN
ncbi:MAG: chloride channel protein [Pseudomonadota bacterium]